MSNNDTLTPQQRWRLRNQEKVCAYIKQYRLKNKDRAKSYRKQYYAKNRERILAQKREKYPEHYAKNAEKLKAAAKKRRINNPIKAKETNLKCKFGISFQEYQDLIKGQQFLCAACHTDLKALPTNEIQVDHNHTTGAIRAILCGPCNRALGLLGDDPIRVKKLATYISKFN